MCDIVVPGGGDLLAGGGHFVGPHSVLAGVNVGGDSNALFKMDSFDAGANAVRF